MATWTVPRFAFCNVPPLPCPECGATDFGEYSVNALRVSWGLAVAQQPVPGFDYEIGDRIRWRSCLDGTVLPWTFFRDGSVNIGDPEIPDVVVTDEWPALRCPDQDQMKDLIERPSPEEIRQLFPRLPWPPIS